MVASSNVMNVTLLHFPKGAFYNINGSDMKALHTIVTYVNKQVQLSYVLGYISKGIMRELSIFVSSVAMKRQIRAILENMLSPNIAE